MSPKKTPVRHTAAPVKNVVKPSIADAVQATPVSPVVAPAVAAAPVAAPVAVAPKAVVAAPAFPTELVAKLRDGSVEVAVEAIEVLAKTGDTRVVAPLIAVLENADGYCHVVTRSAAAMALAKFNDAKTIAALTVAARDPMAEVSCEAALALGELKATAAIGTLTEIAANTSGFYLNVSRHAAIRSLGRMKATAAKSTLTTVAASTSEDAAIVAAARESLGQL